MQAIFRAVLLSATVLSAYASAATTGTATEETSAKVVSLGRIDAQLNGWRSTWPGVMLSTRFDGTAIGITLDDASNYYTAEIDHKEAKVIPPQSGQRTVWIKGLSAGPHQLDLIKRTESPGQAGKVVGFVLDGGRWLPAPPPSSRQIEFIGDSWTAALGNLKNQRECSQDVIAANSDVGQGFAIKVAKHYGADWQVNAMSGMGMVRNWEGNQPREDFRTYYPRTLQNEASSTYRDAKWHPQLIVIGLGINDFSTNVKAGETWTAESLAAQYKNAYLKFLADLRSHNKDAQIITTATRLWPNDALRPLVQEVVAQARQAGDDRIAYVEYSDIQLTACHWHPSQADHDIMANQLIGKIDQLRPDWH
ncbi:SGNH/GDSL hydrolase family protein [Andreprevotia chitinilytica]|uniref:SGNH/GDSL hydrolase family protein n=1 Tax=Andreprevotia chitinilytica TaxID=396808 RepID=UPI000689D3DE|nr:SGNH/GDSL hydrolase family protein [Andreprevotia chitinilytica]